jgi:cellobiose-specific phosphotransferase system component IIB
MNNKEIQFSAEKLIESVQSFAKDLVSLNNQNYYMEKEINELQKYKSFVKSLLNPDEYGHAVTAEVRDQARILLGMKPVESKIKK